jgi:3-phosphoshikimate 1-carboxyvinyltransferase
MAMAFTPAAIRFAGLQIENPEVVSKSYPDFWNELKNAGFVIK